MKITNKKKKELLYKTLRIRIIEEKIAEIYPKQEIRTPVHFSIGQEAISVGVCEDLTKQDSVFSSHRSHGAYLAKGGELSSMVAELFGKRTGSSKGVAGSAHLSSPEVNMFSAPILGSLVPVAVGSAYASKMDRSKDIAVSFCGDSAIEEGVFSESVNFAVLKKIPVLFVCENNLFSTHTPLTLRQPDIPIFKRVRAMGIDTVRLDGNNVVEVYENTKKIIADIRRRGKPFFMECMTYRYREHVGPCLDLDNPYRTSEELNKWVNKCPIKRLSKELLDKKILKDVELAQMISKINKEIIEAIDFAKKSPWPKHKEMTNNVY